MQAHVLHPRPTLEARRGPGRPKKVVSEAVGDWASTPAPAPFGDGRGCRACGRMDELETEHHLLGMAASAAAAASGTLIVCDCCESEYHVACLQVCVWGVPIVQVCVWGVPIVLVC